MSRPLHKERRCHPSQQDSPPLPTTPPDTPCAYACVGRVCIVLANLLFFTSLRARQYPTVTATSRRGSSARFDGDIGHIIIDASLVCRRVATRERGCRRQRINNQRNKSTRGCNALASTDPPNKPITPAIARGHLLLDGQHPQ